MCWSRSFGVSTLSMGLSLRAPTLAPRRHDPDHLAPLARLELADARIEVERQADLVPAGQELRLAVRRLVQDELRLLRAVRVEAYVVEEEARVPRRALGLSQEARWDDAVGVDVRQIDGRGDGGEPCEGLHLVHQRADVCQPARHR